MQFEISDYSTITWMIDLLHVYSVQLSVRARKHLAFFLYFLPGSPPCHLCPVSNILLI